MLTGWLFGVETSNSGSKLNVNFEPYTQLQKPVIKPNRSRRKVMLRDHNDFCDFSRLNFSPSNVYCYTKRKQQWNISACAHIGLSAAVINVILQIKHCYACYRLVTSRTTTMLTGIHLTCSIWQELLDKTFCFQPEDFEKHPLGYGVPDPCYLDNSSLWHSLYLQSVQKV